MKLEKKHIYAYLEHDVKVNYFDTLIGMAGGYIEGQMFNPLQVFYNGQDNENIKAVMSSDIFLTLEDVKLILRPLSDLTKEIEVNGENVNPSEILISKNFGFSEKSGCIEEYLDAFTLHYKDYNEYPYWLIQFLCKYHFDFMGLIPAGLAVDINTFNKPKDSPGGYGGC